LKYDFQLPLPKSHKQEAIEALDFIAEDETNRWNRKLRCCGKAK
jgi:hypothetical protein